MNALRNDAVLDGFERRLHAALPISGNAGAKSLFLALAGATGPQMRIKRLTINGIVEDSTGIGLV